MQAGAKECGKGEAHSTRRARAGQIGVGRGIDALGKLRVAREPRIHLRNILLGRALLRAVNGRAAKRTAKGIFYVAGDAEFALAKGRKGI